MEETRYQKEIVVPHPHWVHSFWAFFEIRKFHVVVVQQQLRNIQKSVMHMQSCCFAI